MLLARMKKELNMLRTNAPDGISCWPLEDNYREWEAEISGTADTPYEGGVFRLKIVIPDRYPFEPPRVSFSTKIYHPNIDDQGRICLDLLKPPPKGSWKPSQNLSTVLVSIQLLLSEPNPDDGLMEEISTEYKFHRPNFVRNAKLWVEQYAKQIHSKRKRHLSEEESADNDPQSSKRIPD